MGAFIGIDPGLSGAIALYFPNAMKGHEFKIFDMPIHKLRRNGLLKNMLDLHGLSNIIDSNNKGVQGAYVEEVGAMPGQGVTSMFSFGFSAGCCQMVIAAHRIPLQTVRPSVWKPEMKVTKDKDSARRMFTMLFPHHADLVVRKKDDGRAEAALIALYGARQNNHRDNTTLEEMLA